ncbi:MULTISPECIES: hypothetical protein [Paenibacillus]|uniref:Uncharacterized protein n=1 Tax=Paenibacillus pabuli TaxID=1472 RepID=A0A855Y6Z5_9BACL|nr:MULTISPECIES: hypothetical protein [Paenibacillus]PWW37371.1 hypothetical protein DET56_109257 [Paenibacillus pabuli]PXW05513.1 hypothetical protein DEU73_108256 [Paenibacillus taichungensis]
MKLLQAAQMSYAGYRVMSCINKVYSPKMLGVKWVGTHYASMNTCEMTDEERKGEWTNGEVHGYKVLYCSMCKVEEVVSMDEPNNCPFCESEYVTVGGLS